jgi:hypothetical protein
MLFGDKYHFELAKAVLSLKCFACCSKEQGTGPPHAAAAAAGPARDEWDDGGSFVARALRNHNVWLILAYVGLILLMARTYA